MNESEVKKSLVGPLQELAERVKRNPPAKRAMTKPPVDEVKKEAKIQHERGRGRIFTHPGSRFYWYWPRLVARRLSPPRARQHRRTGTDAHGGRLGRR